MNNETKNATDALTAVEVLVEMEIRRFAHTIADVKQSRAAGLLDAKEALQIVSIHCNAARTAMQFALAPLRRQANRHE